MARAANATQREVARKGLSNHRWIVGAKLALVTDDCGQIVGFSVVGAGANVHDTTFHPLIAQFEEEMIVLGDQGFKAKETKNKEKKPKKTRGRPKKQPISLPPAKEVTVEPVAGAPAEPANPANLKICSKGRWNERMIIETIFSLLTVVLKMKKLTDRLMAPLKALLAYTCAIFNICTAWHGDVKLQIAPFAL